MRKKAILAGVLCALLTTSLLAGCGEPTTTPSTAAVQTKGTPLGSQAEERFGLHAFDTITLKLPTSWNSLGEKQETVNGKPLTYFYYDSTPQITAIADREQFQVAMQGKLQNVLDETVQQELIDDVKAFVTEYRKVTAKKETYNGIDGFRLSYTGKQKGTKNLVYFYDSFYVSGETETMKLLYASPIEHREHGAEVFQQVLESIDKKALDSPSVGNVLGTTQKKYAFENLMVSLPPSWTTLAKDMPEDPEKGIPLEKGRDFTFYFTPPGVSTISLQGFQVHMTAKDLDVMDAKAQEELIANETSFLNDYWPEEPKIETHNGIKGVRLTYTAANSSSSKLPRFGEVFFLNNQSQAVVLSYITSSDKKAEGTRIFEEILDHLELTAPVDPVPLPSSSDPYDVEAEKAKRPPYDRVSIGDSYREVVEILGEPDRVVYDSQGQLGSMKSCDWNLSDSKGSFRANLVFYNGVLDSKTRY